MNYRQIQSKSCEHKVALFCEAYSQSMKESNFLFNILNSLKTELRRETGIKSAVSVCVDVDVDVDVSTLYGCAGK